MFSTASPNLSFQAWNSKSSREMLAQLATARAAAATSSSFILPDKQADRGSRTLRLNSFTSALLLKHFLSWRWMSHARCHRIGSVSRILWTSLSSFPQACSRLYEPRAPAPQEMFVCVCLRSGCLPAFFSTCAVKFEVEAPVADAGLYQRAVLI